MQGGRTGYEIASTLEVFLDELFQTFLDNRSLITWLDICVPQNRNSIMNYNIKSELYKNSQLERIIMKYCESVNSLIQRVDRIHSVIESALKSQDVNFPLNLVKKIYQHEVSKSICDH